MMQRRLPRFEIRTLLIAVALVACLFGVGLRAKRIHSAAIAMEADGGDVWLNDTNYSGSAFGSITPRTRTQILLDRATIVYRLLTGGETELWVCFVPDDREAFCHTVEVLNPSAITFDVIGETDRTWLFSRFPDLTVSAVCGTNDADTNSTPVVPRRGNDASVQMSQQDTLGSFENAIRLLDENPQLTYRLDRYDTLIGYPVQGEMGRLRDKESGRVIYLPWPK